MRTIELPDDYAQVLQQLHAEGEEDFGNLAESLRYDRRRLSHIIHALQHKGLIQINWRRNNGWISLSSHGRRFIATVWPSSPQLKTY